MSDAIHPDTIVQVLGVAAPSLNVRTNWPLVFAALQKYSEDDLATQIAAIATIGVETGSFSPIKERGGPAYFTKLYEGRADLGNVHEGDGPLFRGRGFVQITGRANYTAYGKAIDADLVANPDLALDPSIAARILAIFFRDHKIPAAAAASKWELVRRRVNGGLNGWSDFAKYINGLEQAIAPALAVAQPTSDQT